MTKAVETFADALLVVQDLATQNQIDENDVAFGDESLAEQAEWQSQALTTVQAFLDGGGASSLPAVGRDVSEIPPESYRADREDDASDLATAIRIVLDMATHNVLSDDSEEMADEVARQEAAVTLVQRLAAIHGTELETPPAPKVG